MSCDPIPVTAEDVQNIVGDMAVTRLREQVSRKRRATLTTVTSAPKQSATTMEKSDVSERFDNEPKTDSTIQPLRILLATEYLPPYVSGIANRCKNLVQKYRSAGHHVTVYSVKGTQCDHVVPSLPNPWYAMQRLFVFPPLGLLLQLLDVFQPCPYDVLHLVTPLAYPFLFIMPFARLRGVKIYVSYHCLLSCYKELYFNPLIVLFLEIFLVLFYALPLILMADVVGVPSKKADSYFLALPHRLHFLRSGVDMDIFKPILPLNRQPSDNENSTEEVKCGTEYPNQNATSIAELLGIFTPPASPPFRPHPPTDGSDTVPAHSLPATARNTEPQPARGPTVVYVGRLAMEKNVEFLVNAMSHLDLHNASLLLVGDGPIMSQLEVLARRVVGDDHVVTCENENDAMRRLDEWTVPGTERLASAPKVVFTGMIRKETNLAKCYALADVFTSASPSETFGFTVAEAMACGTPAVVVKAGAFPAAYPMLATRMFEEGNVSEYVGMVQKVWREGLLARQAARRIAVRHYSVDNAVDDVLRVFKDMTGRGR